MISQLEDHRSLPMIPQNGVKSCFCSKKEYRKELKQLKAELASKPNKAGKHKDNQPELKFEGNKKQYQLNKNLLAKIKVAKDVGDDDLRNNNFQDVCQLMQVQDLEPVSPVQVNGRLKKNIAFWKDIGASKWVLSVIENCYYLHFISLPARRSFQNHPSVVQNQEFVCQELEKLLPSGVLVDVRQEDVLVVNPLGVVKNASGKSWIFIPAGGKTLIF